MRRPVLVVVMLVALAGALIYVVTGWHGDIRMVKLGLQTEEGIFFYTQETSQAVDAQLQAGQPPMLFSIQKLLQDGDELYVEPWEMNAIVRVLSGRYRQHPYAEQTYAGYLSAEGSVPQHLTSENVSTETLGEQAQRNTTALFRASGDTLRIQWTFNPGTGRYEALENCEVKSFTVKTNPQPGETVLSEERFLVVPLERIGDFLQPGSTYSLLPEENVLLLRW